LYIFNLIQIILSVTEYAHSISIKEQERLFQPIERLGETPGNKPGLELELLVCKRLKEAHG
jgi:hypothetical protein